MNFCSDRTWLILLLAIAPLGSLGPAPVAAGEPSEAAETAEQQAISPQDDVIRLFNGKDFSGLYTWMQDTEYEDPRDVFTIQDGLLRVSGDGFGALITKDNYRDYHLVIEFKWGDQTWGSRVDRSRDSGVLVHCIGPDGNYAGRWMTSIEAQIIEGGTGDFIVVSGKKPDGSPLPASLTAEVTTDRDGETVWKEGGEEKTLNGGRVNWFGRDPDWEDVKGFRGDNDVESPAGEWTRMDVICDGDRVVVKVNGVKVNEALSVSPSAGKILLQTELAELFVRRWELWPLGKLAPVEEARVEGGDESRGE